MGVLIRNSVPIGGATIPIKHEEIKKTICDHCGNLLDIKNNLHDKTGACYCEYCKGYTFIY